MDKMNRVHAISMSLRPSCEICLAMGHDDLTAVRAPLPELLKFDRDSVFNVYSLAECLFDPFLSTCESLKMNNAINTLNLSAMSIHVRPYTLRHLTWSAVHRILFASQADRLIDRAHGASDFASQHCSQSHRRQSLSASCKAM